MMPSLVFLFALASAVASGIALYKERTATAVATVFISVTLLVMSYGGRP
jgi:hypothetical protein